MTTLNTIIEEEKEKARKQFDDSPVSLRIDALESYAHVHGWSQFEGRTIQDEIDTIVTTAMQRAYEAGKADSTQENTPDTEWEKWVRTLSNSTNPRDTDLLIAKIAVLLTSRDTYWKERVGDINKSFVDFMESFVENGDNEIDLESLEEWRQHTLLDNLK